MYNLSYGGARAEEKPSPLGQSVLSGYLQGISSYIPNSIKSTIKKQIYTSPSIVEGDKDTIVGTYFDECEILGKKHKLLNICYNNGFQIWDLDNPEGVKEIFSLREGLTKFVKILPTPAEKETPGSVFYGKRPLLAVVSGDDNPKVTRNMVRIFSLRTTELVNGSKFRSPVFNVIANDKIILVCLKERIVGFDPVTMTKMLSLPTFPSLSQTGVIALGSRWLAYTDSQAVHSSPPSSYLQQLKSFPNNQTFGDTAVDVATDLAKEVAQKLYYFGDIGRKKVSSYLYPDDVPAPSATSPQEYRDAENSCVIYVLKRGITNASCQGISVNDTSKWVALTTSRGTTRGDVNIHTHISRNPNSKKHDYFSNIPNYFPSLMTLSAMDRIKLGNAKEENSMHNKVASSITAGNSCFLETTTPNLERLYVVNQNGQLILYELRPQPPTNPEMDSNTLCVSLTPVSEWDVCRKTRTGEFKSPAIPYNENTNEEIVQDSEARWLFNVEITTHSQDIRAIWGVPQFSFRNSSSYKPSPDSLSFFDEDYPIGDVIKFEKKKSTISSPRSDL
eukprot:gene3810-4392_t